MANANTLKRLQDKAAQQKHPTTVVQTATGIEITCSDAGGKFTVTETVTDADMAGGEFDLAGALIVRANETITKKLQPPPPPAPKKPRKGKKR